LLVGLSLGEMDVLGWTDGVAVGWTVGWTDFIDGSALGNSLGFELRLIVGFSVGVPDLLGWTDGVVVG
jgi:hypothetical protein